MGIKIHHGPDGTFKTSGAIKDDILPVIKNGRTLVTNVRGFSRQNAIKVLGRKKVHKDFKVIFVDTEVQQGRDKLARFFHWAPNGAFFVIDEVQRIFKPKWRDKDIQLLNYEGGSDKAAQDDRPEDMDTAWDMQRHYNWDFVFTTTSITKVRSEMKDMAKVAIRHSNIGIWRFYKTVEHPCDSRGTTKSTQGTVKNWNFVPKKVFKLYSSTKTGTFANSEPRTPPHKDPKVVGLLTCLVLFWIYLFNKPVPTAIGGNSIEATSKNEKPIQPVSQTSTKVSNQNSPNQNSSVSNLNISDVRTRKVSSLDSFLHSTYITGSVYSTNEKHYTFEANHSGNDLSFSSLDLKDFGYSVKWIKPCKASITRADETLYIYCSTNNLLAKNYKTEIDMSNTVQQNL